MSELQNAFVKFASKFENIDTNIMRLDKNFSYLLNNAQLIEERISKKLNINDFSSIVDNLHSKFESYLEGTVQKM